MASETPNDDDAYSRIPLYYMYTYKRNEWENHTGETLLFLIDIYVCII